MPAPKKPKKTAKKPAKKPPKKPPKQPTVYDTALEQATAAYAPAIRPVRDRAMAIDQHTAKGGVLDQAFDRSGAAISESQRLAQEFSQGQAKEAENFGAAGVQAVAALGGEQVARAQEAQRLYGQTAAAAEEAAKTMGAAGISQGAAANNMVGTMRALGVIQSNRAPGLTAANEGRRGEARTELGKQRTELTGDLADLRSKRAALALETATGMIKEDRNFNLAMETLGQRDADSLRDYQATMAGIGEQARQANIRAEDTDADRTSRETIATADRLAADARAREGKAPSPLDLARFDKNGDGVLSPGEALDSAPGAKGAGGKSKGATIYVGRDGKPLDVSPSVRAKQVQNRARLGTYMKKARQATSSGKYKNADEARKAAGLRDIPLWELAMAYAAARASGDSTPISREYLEQLKAMFYMGEIPTDIARLIDR